MAKKLKNSALGKGLKALIKDRSNEKPQSKKELDIERHARNMEFYGSLMKKYVRSGVDDEMIDQMMEDIRSHMGISKKEHNNLLETLRKREIQNPPKESEKQLAETEIKEELALIYDNIHKGSKKKGRFAKMEKEMKKGKGISILLPNGETKEQPKVAKIIRRRLVARDLDERAGIITGPKIARKGRLEWLDEEEEEPIRASPPREGLEDVEEPIRASPPREGLEDVEEPIRASPPREGLEDGEEVLISGPVEERGSEPELEQEKEEEKELDLVEEPEEVLESEDEPEIQELEEEEIPEKIADDDIEEVQEVEEPIPEEEPEEIEEVEEDLEEEDEDLEEVEEMEEDLEEVEEMEEEAPETILDDSLLSVKMLMEEDRIGEAAEMADRLLEKEPDNISLLNEMGVILYRLGKLDEALHLYSDILDREPDSVETMINYATLLSMQGQLDDSLLCLEKAVKKDPYSEDAWNNKAVVLTRAGRLREALECLDEALRINDKTPSTWMNAGIILEKMGEIGPAMECYQSLLEIEPENDIAREGIAYCRSLLEE